MKVRIHRGGHEVSGAFVEIEHQGDRIVLAVGVSETPDRGERVALPRVSGLSEGSDPRLRGVLVAGPQLDSLGLAGRLSPRVPLYVGPEAAAITQASGCFTAEALPSTPVGCLEDRQPLHLGQFTITPQRVDHCGVDAYVLVIDAGAERLLFTDHLQASGRRSSPVGRLVAHPPTLVDTLLMTGTGVPSGPAVRVAQDGLGESEGTEADLERDLAETVLATDGLAVVLSAAQHLDRLVTAYRACLRSGRTLLVDPYAATVAQATGRPTLPQPGFPQLGVYVPDGQQRAMTSGGLHRLEPRGTHRVQPREIAAHPEDFVVLSGMSTVPELLRCGVLDRDGVVVWSRGLGVLRHPSGLALKSQLRSAGIDLVVHHTSHHVVVDDLSQLVTAIEPRHVVLMDGGSARGADRRSPTSDVYTTVPDSSWWEVAPTRTRAVIDIDQLPMLA